MKNIIKIFLSTLLIFSFNSCEDSDNVIDGVVAKTQSGAVLRTIGNVISSTLNRSLPETAFSVEVEEQDIENGALLKSVDVYVTLRDLSPNTGDSSPTVADGKPISFLVKTIPASAFSSGPLGLPRATISATFGESEAAMGLNNTNHSPGDLFVFELRLNLTDGRTFGADSAAGIITGGYWSSPYKYNALLLCAPKPGDYTIDMHDSYGDGWQTDVGNGGSGIKINLKSTSGDSTIEVGMCSPYGGSNVGTFLASGDCTGPASTSFSNATKTFTIPVGTTEATFNFPGDTHGEISFEIYAPDGSLLLAVGVGEGTPGLLPVTNCL